MATGADLLKQLLGGDVGGGAVGGTSDLAAIGDPENPILSHQLYENDIDMLAANRLATSRAIHGRAPIFGNPNGVTQTQKRDMQRTGYKSVVRKRGGSLLEREGPQDFYKRPRGADKAQDRYAHRADDGANFAIPTHIVNKLPKQYQPPHHSPAEIEAGSGWLWSWVDWKKWLHWVLETLIDNLASVAELVSWFFTETSVGQVVWQVVETGGIAAATVLSGGTISPITIKVFFEFIRICKLIGPQVVRVGRSVIESLEKGADSLIVWIGKVFAKFMTNLVLLIPNTFVLDPAKFLGEAAGFVAKQAVDAAGGVIGGAVRLAETQIVDTATSAGKVVGTGIGLFTDMSKWVITGAPRYIPMSSNSTFQLYLPIPRLLPDWLTLSVDQWVTIVRGGAIDAAVGFVRFLKSIQPIVAEICKWIANSAGFLALVSMLSKIVGLGNPDGDLSGFPGIEEVEDVVSRVSSTVPPPTISPPPVPTIDGDVVGEFLKGVGQTPITPDILGTISFGDSFMSALYGAAFGTAITGSVGLIG